MKDCGQAIALLMVAERLNHRIYNVSAGRLVRYSEVIAAINAVVPGAHITLPPGRNPAGRRTAISTPPGCGRTQASGLSTTSSAR